MTPPHDTMEAVRQARERILQSKASVVSRVQDLDARLDDPALSQQQKLAAVLAVYSAVVEHLNLVETTVAVEELARHNDNDHFRAFGGESSLSALAFALGAIPQMQELARRHGQTQAIPVDPTAYAGMQRLAVEADSELAAELKAGFAAAGLPVYGFNTPIKRRPVAAAELEYDEGGLKSVKGVESHDAAKIATTVARVGEKGFSAPVTPVGVDEALKAYRPPGAKGVKAWLLSMTSSAAGRLTAWAVAAGVVAVAGWFGIRGCTVNPADVASGAPTQMADRPDVHSSGASQVAAPVKGRDAAEDGAPSMSPEEP